MTDSNILTLLEPEAITLIGQYGLPYPEHGMACSAEEAAAIAERLAAPVVLKIVSPQISHKSDVGGVLLGLPDPKSVVDGYGEITARVKKTLPDVEITGVLVCRQAEPGLEVIIGGLRDPIFGPAVMFGLGGVFTELLNDITFRIAPLLPVDAQEMIVELKGKNLLSGYKGQPAVDVSRLVEALQAVGRLMVERGNVVELDLNPIRLYPDGLLVLDARIIERAV